MAETTIGPNITIDGEITGTEPLVVAGVVKGQINLESSVTVEQGGYVEADVTTNTVQIDGHLTGNVSAYEKVEVRPNGRMVGDIKSPRIHIADGAAFKGHIDMDVD